MRRLIIGTAGNAVALWAAARIVGNVDLSRSWWTVLLASLALFFISMLMLWITDVLVGGFEIDGFWAYVKATIIVWIVNLIVEAIFDPKGSDPRRVAESA